ncbi:MAG: hypothetical protein JNK82_25010 [Myxococcaceae bacterium]|nr:hypothetical protein [Myxococcaceae bacterium]
MVTAHTGRTAAYAITLALWACGPAPEPEPESFVPFASHFARYTSWESFVIPGGAQQEDAHVSGDRTLYLKRRPPRGATRYPVGTLIVKVTPLQVFAMAKRGGGYNAQGAVDWEWLELEGTVEQPFIRWRGIGAPDGEGYGPPGESSCNLCHDGAAHNDFVRAAPLQLSEW